MLECNAFAITEHKKIFSSVQSYDIKNGETGETVGTAREAISGMTQVLRWVVSKQLLPAAVEVREKPDDALVFTDSLDMGAITQRTTVANAAVQAVAAGADVITTNSYAIVPFHLGQERHAANEVGGIAIA